MPSLITSLPPTRVADPDPTLQKKLDPDLIRVIFLLSLLPLYQPYPGSDGPNPGTDGPDPGTDGPDPGTDGPDPGQMDRIRVRYTGSGSDIPDPGSD